MQDPFTSRPTCIRGRTFPNAEQRACLQGDIRRRLAALDLFCTAAARVGIGTDPDDDLVLWAEEELSLFQSADDCWAELAEAAKNFRLLTPIIPLETFGFPENCEDLIGDGSPHLTYVGGGVEASVFLGQDASVYKFYLPQDEGTIAGSFCFRRAEGRLLTAYPSLGSYRSLFQRMLVLDHLDGMPTEVMGVSPEGIVILKQVQGARLEPEQDIQRFFPSNLISVPARLLRAYRDHPRLVFVDGILWFIADLHEKNFVVGLDGAAHVVDAIVAPFPMDKIDGETVIIDWLARAEVDPAAPLLPPVSDDEL